MASINGTIVLGGVTDKQLEMIWGHKAKHEGAFSFLPQTMQTQNLGQNRVVYNNVQFAYGNLQGLNLITEIVNEIEKREKQATAVNQ